jgi:hypothetical protein
MHIPSPTVKEVEKYLSKWGSLEGYVLQESSLKKLFTKTYPENKDMDDILIKVCSLNDFYSTNIFSPFKISRHIFHLNIDRRLEANDLTLVNDIANVKVGEGREINFYSFATKYCSHHRPLEYPIYDYYVDKILMHFKKHKAFSEFKRIDLKEYVKYHNVLLDFRSFYNLDKFNLKEIDQYLWQLGKEHFAKKY